MFWVSENLGSLRYTEGNFNKLLVSTNEYRTSTAPASMWFLIFCSIYLFLCFKMVTNKLLIFYTVQNPKVTWIPDPKLYIITVKPEASLTHLTHSHSLSLTHLTYSLKQSHLPKPNLCISFSTSLSLSSFLSTLATVMDLKIAVKVAWQGEIPFSFISRRTACDIWATLCKKNCLNNIRLKPAC